MAGDVTLSQVLSAEHIVDVLLERFLLLGIYIFGPMFLRNIQRQTYANAMP